MEFGTGVYKYFDKVFWQLEGIVCALVAFIENAGSKAESYHYEVFNRVMNEIRALEIQAVSEIRYEYQGIRDSLGEAGNIMRASEESMSFLKDKLNDGEECLSRLLTQSQNIKEFHSSTDNPYIPDNDDEVYDIFQGYRRVIDGYSVDSPETDNVISNTIFSFYNSSVGIFSNLFGEYDKILDDLAADVDNKRMEAFRHEVNISNGRKAIAKAAVDVLMTTGLALTPDAAFETINAIAPVAAGTKALKIEKKNAADVAIAGIGLCAAVSEHLEELSPNKKSLARTALNKVKEFNQAIDLTEEVLSAMGVEDDVSCGKKLAFAAVAMSSIGTSGIEHIGESKTKDLFLQGVSFTGSVADFAASKGALERAANWHKMLDEGLGLVEEAAKYCEENDLHTSKVQKVFHKIGTQLKEYDSDVEKYQYNLARGLPAKKPKAPPVVRIRWPVHFVSVIIGKGKDFYEAYKGFL